VDQLGTTLFGKAFLDVSVNWRVLSFTIAAMVVTTALCGLAPAWRTSRLQPIDALKARGTGLRSRSTGALIVSQIALSLVLVVLAGLFVGSFVHLVRADLGFEPRDLLVVEVSAQHSVSDRTSRIPLFERIGEAVRSVPGVADVAISNSAPFLRGEFRLGFRVPEVSRELIARGAFVSPGWFSTYRVRLLAGREFDHRDRLGAPPVVIVTQSFMTRYLNGMNALGRTIYDVSGNPNVRYQIVGVAADTAFGSVQDTRSNPIVLYFPLGQYDTRAYPQPSSIKVSVRAASGDPEALGRAVATAIGNVDADLSVNVRTLSDQVRLSMSQERLLAILAGFFGVLALLLAMVGQYGVTSFGVSQRRTEMAIRMALGGTPRNVVWMTLRQVGQLLAIGTVTGLLMSWWVTALIAPSLLFGLEKHDPATMAVALAALVIVGTCAGLIPARRAAGVDPLVALRYE
jgi:predicted permease